MYSGVSMTQNLVYLLMIHVDCFQFFSIKNYGAPWLVLLSGLSAGLHTERSPVRFPVRAHS